MISAIPGSTASVSSPIGCFQNEDCRLVAAPFQELRHDRRGSEWTGLSNLLGKKIFTGKCRGSDSSNPSAVWTTKSSKKRNGPRRDPAPNTFANVGRRCTGSKFRVPAESLHTDHL